MDIFIGGLILFVFMWYCWYTACANLKNWDIEQNGGYKSRTYHYVDKKTAERWK